jgi:UDP-N-acetylglucosamine 4,6-dehydratase
VTSVTLITGGTGSFGTTIMKRLLKEDSPDRVLRIFSRDETKQDALRQAYGKDSRIEYVIGDVRDYESVDQACYGVDTVYHAAALKQVPSCETHVMEAVKTNVLGAENVRRAAIFNGVNVVVGLSTDKAVEPISAMGLTKALMERIFSQPSEFTRFFCVRYGNVLGSRGSVVPLFLDRIRRKLPLQVTVPTMTRFLLSLDDAAGLVIEAAKLSECGGILVKKMPATTVMTLAKACMPHPKYPLEVIGARPGEKHTEVLVCEDEAARAEERGGYYYIGALKLENACANRYTSSNTTQLDVTQTRKMLRRAGLLP